MNHILSDKEWTALHSLLNEPSTSSGAKLSAQASIFRLNTRMPGHYRTFGWASLPVELGVTGKTANRFYTKWVRSGVWFEFWDGLIAHRFGEAGVPIAALSALHNSSPLVAAVIELERSYRFFNHRFVGGSLPATTKISIQASPNTRMKGYLAENMWGDSSGRKDHHIAILQSSLGNSANALHTLLHEMAHLRNSINRVQDTDPRTQYHTIDFRDSAWLFGLSCEQAGSKGFAATALAPRAIQAIETLKPVERVFLDLKSVVESE